jgi:paraquat-inducible protein B
MSKKANPTAVGSFVLLGLALGVGGVLLFGSASWFTKPMRFILYFESSLKGLAPGAVVAVSGVKVGQVAEVMLRHNQREEDIHRPVLIEVDRRLVEKLSDRPFELDNPAVLKRLIERGLRAKLQAESLVTGVLFIELGVIPDASPPVYHQVEARYLEIPTVPNEIALLLDNLAKMDFDRVFTRLDAVMEVLTRRLEEFNAAGISSGLTNVLANLGQVVSSPDLTNALASGRQALEEIRRLSVTLRERTDPLASRAEVALDEVTGTLRDLRQTSETLRQTLAPHSGLTAELTDALDELRQAARAVAELAEFLTRNPNALISGRERTVHPR